MREGQRQGQTWGAKSGGQKQKQRRMKKESASNGFDCVYCYSSSSFLYALSSAISSFYLLFSSLPSFLPFPPPSLYLSLDSTPIQIFSCPSQVYQSIKLPPLPLSSFLFLFFFSFPSLSSFSLPSLSSFSSFSSSSPV